MSFASGSIGPALSGLVFRVKGVVFRPQWLLVGCGWASGFGFRVYARAFVCVHPHDTRCARAASVLCVCF